MSTGCCTSPTAHGGRWSGRCGFPRSARAGRARFASCWSRPSTAQTLSPATAWEGFAPLTVTAVHRREQHHRLLRAAASRCGRRRPEPPPANTSRFGFATDGPAHAPVVRTYSLSAIRPDDGYRISVKLEPGGRGSAFLHEQVKLGDTIDAAAPRGEFVLRDNDHPVALISAGVGATPVLAMLRTLAETPRHPSGLVDPRSAQWPGARLPARRSTSCSRSGQTAAGSPPTAVRAPATCSAPL